MSDNLSSAFSHLVLAGTGVACLVGYNCGRFRLPTATYTIIITNSILGVWRWGSPAQGEKLEKPYQFTGFLQSAVALPFIVTEVWLGYGYQKELAYLHSIISIFPFSLYLADKRSKQDVLDLVLGINCESLIIVSFLERNYYGVAVAVSFLFSHLCLLENDTNFEDISALDLCNYSLCLFCYFTLQTLKLVAGKTSQCKVC